jgi:hypothetical protein
VFTSFQKQEVKYMVIGGIAAILYGVPRATFDLDILIEATIEKAQKLHDALIDAKFGTASLIFVRDLVETEITVFEDRVRIDVQTSTPGIEFEKAWKNRQVMSYHGQKFYIVSKEVLVASKRADGCKVDLEDVLLLEIDKWNQ